MQIRSKWCNIWALVPASPFIGILQVSNHHYHVLACPPHVKKIGGPPKEIGERVTHARRSFLILLRVINVSVHIVKNYTSSKFIPMLYFGKLEK